MSINLKEFKNKDKKMEMEMEKKKKIEKKENAHKVEKINDLSTDKLIEKFEGGIQKSRMKIIFLILIIIVLFLIMFF